MLGFQAEGVVAFVRYAAYAGEFAIQEIAGVELDAWFSSPYFHDSAGVGIGDSGAQFPFAGFAVEAEVVIVAVGVAGGFFDVQANGFSAGEVEDRVFDWSNFAGGDECVIG